MSSNPNQVVVAGDYGPFVRLCERLEANEEGLTKILAIVHDESTQGDFTLLMRRLCTNRTLQVLSVGLSAALRTNQLEEFGRVFVSNESIKSLRLFNVAREAMDMSLLWQGLFQSKTIKNVALDGFRTDHNAVHTLVQKWNDRPANITDFHLSESWVGKSAADAIVTLLGKQDIPHFNFRMTQCTFQDPHDKVPIVNALAHNTTVEIFALSDDLDEISAQALGKALQRNRCLHGVILDGLSDTALPLVTHGLLGNHRMLNATLSGFKSGNNFENNNNNNNNSDNRDTPTIGESVVLQECKRQVAHSIAMNKSGRCLMFDYAQKGKSLDVAWLVCLGRSLDDSAIIYSWIRDYTDIFVRWSLSPLPYKRRRSEPSSLASGINLRLHKKAKTTNH
jgi:hypothetical protein